MSGWDSVVEQVAGSGAVGASVTVAAACAGTLTVCKCCSWSNFPPVPGILVLQSPTLHHPPSFVHPLTPLHHTPTPAHTLLPPPTPSHQKLHAIGSTANGTAVLTVLTSHGGTLAGTHGFMAQRGTRTGTAKANIATGHMAAHRPQKSASKRAQRWKRLCVQTTGSAARSAIKRRQNSASLVTIPMYSQEWLSRRR